MEVLDKLYTRLEETDATIDKLLANENLSADQLAEHDKLQTSRKAILAAIDRENDKISRQEERQRHDGDRRPRPTTSTDDQTPEIVRAPHQVANVATWTPVASSEAMRMALVRRGKVPTRHRHSEGVASR